MALAPLTFTAGSTPGTATFTAGDINVVSLIHGGQLNGDDATLSCTPPSNNTIGTVSIVKSTTSTVPVGAVGGAALAGLLGVGGGVAYVVRRRRTSRWPTGSAEDRHETGSGVPFRDERHPTCSVVQALGTAWTHHGK